MGGVVKGIGTAVGGASNANSPAHPLATQVACLQAQVAHLTKLVHALWQDAEQVAKILHIDGEGLHIMVGSSNFKVLRAGAIVLDAPQVKGKGGADIGASFNAGRR
jgi:outer membrane murein-binding lipoprotein Lpp